MLCFRVVASQGININAGVKEAAAVHVLSSSNAHPEQQQQQQHTSSAPGHRQANRELCPSRLTLPAENTHS